MWLIRFVIADQRLGSRQTAAVQEYLGLQKHPEGPPLNGLKQLAQRFRPPQLPGPGLILIVALFFQAHKLHRLLLHVVQIPLLVVPHAPQRNRQPGGEGKRRLHLFKLLLKLRFRQILQYHVKLIAV